MKKSFKQVIEQVLEIIFINFQVHTTRFVTFTTQKPSDIQVMMLAVRSQANAKLIQLVRCKFEVSWVKFVGIRPTQIYYQLKKSLNMLMTCSIGVIHEIF